jgi:hypothetical protein
VALVALPQPECGKVVRMDTVAIALVLRSILALLLLALIVRPICWVIWKLLPEGRVKRFLFRVY